MARYNRTAMFSPCGTYRYELGGDIGPQEPLFRSARSMQRVILWILLNPSKADTVKDDNTVKTAVRFSERWGYGGIMVGNLSAYIATDPFDMKRAEQRGVDVIGPDNDHHLKTMIALAVGVVCGYAWPHLDKLVKGGPA